jgi:hypothetical protein
MSEWVKVEDMSDFEVNKALAEKLGFTVETRSVFKINVPCVVTESGDIHKLSDYCSNWSDIMPLAVEHKISVDWYTDGRCMAFQDVGGVDYDYTSVQPQRARACCLILVLQEQEA